MNLSSNSIQVYPTSLRTDTYDRNARINSEFNITNLINRLTGRDSFIIDGITTLVDGVINAGEFNIKGYYFNLPSAVTLDSTLVSSPSANDVIYFTITIKDMPIDSNSDVKFKQINGRDTGGDGSKYTGLTIVKIANGSTQPYDAEGSADDVTHYLPIFKYTGSSWVAIESSRLSFDLDQLAVTNKDPGSVGTTIMADAGLSKNTTDTIRPLNKWLLEDFIIDDGTI